jgi:hypothetical protein
MTGAIAELDWPNLPKLKAPSYGSTPSSLPALLVSVAGPAAGLAWAALALNGQQIPTDHAAADVLAARVRFPTAFFPTGVFLFARVPNRPLNREFTLPFFSFLVLFFSICCVFWFSSSSLGPGSFRSPFWAFW